MSSEVFKYFAVDDLNQAISAVELRLFGVAGRTTYVSDGKLRLISLACLSESVRHSTYHQLRSGKLYWGIKGLIRHLVQTRAKRYDIASAADTILIRNNISLLYRRRGVRAKFFMEQGVRSLEGFRNEYEVRCRLERSGIDFIPPMLSANLDQPPYYFVDTLIEGEGLSWDDARTAAILRDVIARMWQLYRGQGITWQTPAALGIDLRAVVAGLIQHGYACADDLVKLTEKLLPVSLIHGDFSIGNIVVACNGSYVVDWELAGQGAICSDLYKVLVRKPELLSDMEAEMCSEAKALPVQQRDRAMPLLDQLRLEYLVRLHRGEASWAERPSILRLKLHEPTQ